jgi:hypothetical protein
MIGEIGESQDCFVAQSTEPSCWEEEACPTSIFIRCPDGIENRINCKNQLEVAVQHPFLSYFYQFVYPRDVCLISGISLQLPKLAPDTLNAVLRATQMQPISFHGLSSFGLFVS